MPRRGAPPELPPGPRSPGWLNAVRYLHDPLGFWTKLGSGGADVAHVKLGPYHCYLVNTPELIRETLAAGDEQLGRPRIYAEVGRVFGRGLFTSEGELHRRQRRTIQPLFASDRLSEYGRVAVEAAARADGRWQPGDVVEVVEEMRSLTLAILTESLFGGDAGNASELVHALSSSSGMLQRFLLPGSGLLWHLPLPSTRRFERTRKQLDSLVYGLIAERRRQADGGEDLLSLLLSAQAKRGEEVTDRQIRDEAVTFLFAGHETLALALSWAWYLLAEHPAAEATLHSELDRVVGARLPTPADLDRLVYAQTVFRETIRLYPPAWAMARRVRREHRVGGYTAPPGSTLFLSQWVSHRDPRFFSDPTAFRPERWDEQPRAHLYFPFGGGPRGCIGERVAQAAGVLVLATIGRRWRLRVAAGARPEPQPALTLKPRGGIPMILHRREGR